MRNLRKLLNGLALGVTCAGALALSPTEGGATNTGVCCPMPGAVCYLVIDGGGCNDSE